MPTPDTWPEELRRRVEGIPAVEPWPMHLDLREMELGLIAGHAKIAFGSRALEIGCGNAYASAYLADRLSFAVATDLPVIDARTHSIGMERARRLLAAAGVTHVQLVGCSGHDLPLPDGSVDVVIGIYSLEHVPDKRRCLDEAYRVTRPGGRIVSPFRGPLGQPECPLLCTEASSGALFAA